MEKKVFKIFVCSPLKSDTKEGVEKNIEFACSICAKIARLYNMFPVAPHVYFTRFLDDFDELDRLLGMNLGIEWLKDCDAMFVYGNPTKGMKNEIEEARKLGIHIYYFEKLEFTHVPAMIMEAI